MNQVGYQEYREIQEALRHRVRIEPLGRAPELIAAVDLHISKDGVGFAAAVLVDESGGLVEERVVSQKISVPYVPGFLSFREMPICRAALLALDQVPQVILVDGQGVAHPRRFGIACHLGVEMDLPTVGVAKSILVGKAREPGQEKGAMEPLVIGDEVVGMAVRTRSNVRPLYVSVGHRITLDEAIDITVQLVTKYRLPDPSRRAHKLARDAATSRI